MRINRIFLICWLFLSTTGAWSQERPELRIQRGHGSGEVIATSPIPGNQVATVSTEGTVKIWDPSTRLVENTIFDRKAFEKEDDAESLVAATFAPDGSWVVTVGSSGEFRRFSLPDGKLLNQFKLSSSRSGGKALLTDGTFLYTPIYEPAEKVVVKLDLNGVVQGKTPIDAPSSNGRWALSPDGAYLALPRDGGLAVVSTGDFQEQGFLKLNYRLQGIAFDPSGQKLALSSDSALAVLSVPSLSVESLIEKSEELGDQIRLPIWNDGIVWLAPAESGGRAPVLKADFSAKSFQPIEQELLVEGVSRLPDGRLLTGSYAGDSFLVDFESGESVELSSDIGGFTSFTVLPDSNDLVTSDRSGTVVRWSAETGRTIQQYEGLEGWVSALEVSPDGTKLIGGDYHLGYVICWDVKTGKVLGKTERIGGGRFAEGVAFLKFLDDGRFFAGSEGRRTLFLFDTSGKLEREWPLPGVAYDVVISNDKTRLAIGHSKGMYEASFTDKRDVLQIGGAGRVNSLVYAGNSRTLFAGNTGGEVFSWDYTDPKNQPQKIFEFGRGSSVKSISRVEKGLDVLSSDGRRVTLSPTGEKLSETKLETGYCAKPEMFSDERIVTIGDNLTIAFFDPATGQRLGSLVGVRNNDGWVALEKSGEFDGNALGLETLHFELGGRLYSVDQFLNDYLRPGALARLLPHGKRAATRSAPELTSATVKRPPSVKILEPKSGQVLDGDTVEVRVQVTDAGGGISGVNISHNGHKLPDDSARTLQDGIHVFQVRAIRGINEFRVSAFDQTGGVESRPDRIRVSAPNIEEVPPRLHLLSVGIDEYSSGLSLKFAEDDSQSVSNLFDSELYAAGSRIHLSNQQATKDGILQAIKRVAAEAAPQDAFVCYLAGHGTVVEDVYYFLPHDVKIETDDALTKSAISSELLADLLREVSATKQLLILDSCRSGAAVGVVGRYFAARSGLEEIRSQQLLARSSGTFMLAATKAEDYAYEIPQLGHGVLTYAVLESLGKVEKTDVSRPEDKITVNGLLQAVSLRVPELSEQYQGIRQQVIQYSSGEDFPISAP